jgi:radical SAM superfamily enzyme YgiQ (UPF0313 family)
LGRGSGGIRHQHAETETGIIRKNWKGKTSIVLVFPNHYAVGLSNLGFQSVYQLLNALEFVVCERAFLPESPGPAVSLESNSHLEKFDIIAFSISFENDYLNLLTLLQSAGIPLQSSKRSEAHPLVIAGGIACFINPEPIAHFIDCILIGEAENLLPRFIEYVESSSNRSELLKNLARKVPGAYVPALYEDRYTSDGILESLVPNADIPRKITRVYVPHLENTATQSVIVTPHASFGNTYLIEVSRGCSHGCRFCSAGFVYRPPRFRPLPLLQACMRKGAEISTKIGLVGAAVSDLPGLGILCDQAHESGIQLSFSSLRVDALTPELLLSLALSRVKTATIAPDAGSERMRRVINKGITEDQILNAAASLVASGIPNLKLYFMVGLPTETIEDVEAIVALCLKIKAVFLESSRVQGRIGEMTISVNTFIPKPATPFQWAPMESIPLLKKKLAIITRGLKHVPNVRVETNSLKEAAIQALLARGDRRVSQLLIRAVHNRGNWGKTFRETPEFSLSFYIHRLRAMDEVLPWDHIDNGVRKKFLEKEYFKALEETVSATCPMTACRMCGACDTQRIAVDGRDG